MPEQNYNSENAPLNRVRFNPEISLGQAIQGLIVLGGVVVPIAWYVMTYAGRVDLQGQTIARLEVSVTSQLTAQKADLTSQIAAQKAETAAQFNAIQLGMNDQFKSLRLDIANLPDVRAELTQLGKRVDQWDSRAGAQSERMNRLETLLIQISARLEQQAAKGR